MGGILGDRNHERIDKGSEIMSNIIEVENLSKNYGTVQALDDISFNVPEQSIVGFLGPNGAGKTTTIGILMQFIHQDAGSVTIFGEDVGTSISDLKHRIGLISDSTLPNVTGYSLLKHTGRYGGLSGKDLEDRISKMIGVVGAHSFYKRYTQTLSKGQKQRIKIANALMNDPDLLIADEATAGLDPLSRREFLSLIENLVENHGKTVFFSNHVISEVEKTCDELIIMNKGRIVNKGKMVDILNDLPPTNTYSMIADGITEKELRNMSSIEEVDLHKNGEFIIRTSDTSKKTPVFLKELVNNNDISITYFSREQVDLEDLFLEVTK